MSRVAASGLCPRLELWSADKRLTCQSHDRPLPRPGLGLRATARCPADRDCSGRRDAAGRGRAVVAPRSATVPIVFVRRPGRRRSPVGNDVNSGGGGDPSPGPPPIDPLGLSYRSRPRQHPVPVATPTPQVRGQAEIPFGRCADNPPRLPPCSHRLGFHPASSEYRRHYRLRRRTTDEESVIPLRRRC